MRTGFRLKTVWARQKKNIHQIGTLSQIEAFTDHFFYDGGKSAQKNGSCQPTLKILFAKTSDGALSSTKGLCFYEISRTNAFFLRW